jgi:hypothetical protein
MCAWCIITSYDDKVIIVSCRSHVEGSLLASITSEEIG